MIDMCMWRDYSLARVATSAFLFAIHRARAPLPPLYAAPAPTFRACKQRAPRAATNWRTAPLPACVAFCRAAWLPAAATPPRIFIRRYLSIPHSFLRRAHLLPAYRWRALRCTALCLRLPAYARATLALLLARAPRGLFCLPPCRHLTAAAPRISAAYILCAHLLPPHTTTRNVPPRAYHNAHGSGSRACLWLRWQRHCRALYRLLSLLATRRAWRRNARVAGAPRSAAPFYGERPRKTTRCGSRQPNGVAGSPRRALPRCRRRRSGVPRSHLLWFENFGTFLVYYKNFGFSPRFRITVQRRGWRAVWRGVLRRHTCVWLCRQHIFLYWTRFTCCADRQPRSRLYKHVGALRAFLR